jgi:site-specific recombinase XerD
MPTNQRETIEKLPTTPSVEESIALYIDSVGLARSNNTARTYSNALNAFSQALESADIKPETHPINELNEDSVAVFAKELKKFSPATETLYLTAVAGFFEFISAERLADPSLPRVRLLIRQRGRRPGPRLPQFPREDIENLLKAMDSLLSAPYEDDTEHLRKLRDRAFITTLANTGLRVHEACALRRGELEWEEGRAIIIGKGNRQAVVRFSTTSLRTLKDYLNVRASLDGSSGKPLASLPIFARHDKGAGKRVENISTTTGRNIIAQRVAQFLGRDKVGSITPHSFRHFFVTTVLRASGGNLKLAQELARHKNIQVTQRYAHLSDDELDRGYFEVFN